MITKGIVEDATNPFSIKVRLPVYDAVEGSRDATANKDLSYATICTLPNISHNVEKGDIVFVSFEDNDVSKPIIIGHLFKETQSTTKNDFDIRKLITNSTTKLYKDTYIGNIKPNEIEMLSGLKANIQLQLNYIQEQLNTLSASMGSAGLYDTTWKILDGNTNHYSYKDPDEFAIDLSTIIDNWQPDAYYEVLYHVDIYKDGTAFTDVYTDLIPNISSTSRGLAVSTNSRSAGYTGTIILNKYLYINNRTYTLNQQNTNILAYRRVR